MKRSFIFHIWVRLSSVRRLAAGQTRVRFSARHPREVFPTVLTGDEEMESNLSERRLMNVQNL
jgi:hypothetical protein